MLCIQNLESSCGECQNVLATEDNLRRRGLSFPSRCSLCLVETKSVNHLLWECDAVVPIWHWLLDIFLLHSCPKSMKDALGMGDNLSRNAAIFKDKKLNRNKIKVTLLALVKESSCLLQNSMHNTVTDLQIILKLGVSTRARPALCIKSCRWILPWYEEIKLNYGSSTMGNPGKVGLGVIARTHTGEVLGVRTKGMGIMNTLEAECFAIMEALS
ncbi:hypothetical protein GIB67_031755 [Kingdonia uniflora]|uniref:Reverse transcriptase zinc-binding domain-containing protein n=1 Tax=Kingdonia uniflora TaxID=39325 RepID=A0A7J7NKR9_9MAGN|nr:hypothetical protein GIB67_031755 [Kingdonia uniflora]